MFTLKRFIQRLRDLFNACGSKHTRKSPDVVIVTTTLVTQSSVFFLKVKLECVSRGIYLQRHLVLRVFSISLYV